MTTDNPVALLRAMRSLTPARIALGQTGAPLPTQALLNFQLDHARARDAVHDDFETECIARAVDALGLQSLIVSSQATSRVEYLKRPDLGRRLSAESQASLSRLQFDPCDVAMVIGDGLSPTAVNRHAVETLRHLVGQLGFKSLGPVVIAGSARVALGDEIGALLKARLIIVLIGERPGLSAPHSIGAYLTFNPRPGISDADRNCVSNIHLSGLSYEEAAFKVAWLARQALARGVTGVRLKDESSASLMMRVNGAQIGQA